MSTFKEWNPMRTRVLMRISFTSLFTGMEIILLQLPTCIEYIFLFLVNTDTNWNEFISSTIELCVISWKLLLLLVLLIYEDTLSFLQLDLSKPPYLKTHSEICSHFCATLDIFCWFLPVTTTFALNFANNSTLASPISELEPATNTT